MNVALVGCGQAATKYHLPSLKDIPKVRVVALADANRKSLRKTGSKFGVTNLYTNVEEMLNKNDIDILDIVTPGYTHHSLASLAISNGVNVLVEKPLCLSLTDARSLKQESDSEGVDVCVIQNYRYRPPLLKLSALLKEGVLGYIQAVNFSVRGGSLFNNPSWFWNEDLSGGLLYELAIHEADLQTWLMGQHEEVMSVWPHYDKGMKLLKGIVAMIRYPENRVASFDLRWFASSPLFRMDVIATVSDAIIKLNPDSIALLEGERSPYSEFRGELDRIVGYGTQVLGGKVSDEYRQPHKRIIRGFVESVEAGTPPPISIEGVMPALKLLEDLKSSAGYAVSRER